MPSATISMTTCSDTLQAAHNSARLNSTESSSNTALMGSVMARSSIACRGFISSLAAICL